MTGEASSGAGTQSRLAADRIARRGFTVARRGYDQDEVRAFLDQLAAEVRGLHSRIEHLEAEAAAEPVEASPVEQPPLDEETVVAMVGEETANVLRAARAAAAELRRRAAVEAERIVDEARQVGGDIRQEAEGALSLARSEAETAAEVLRSGALTEAEQITLRARLDADAVREQAEQDRRLTVDGAQAVREKILGDLSRRRRVATVQIEQLRAGRERLLESYAIVRRTLEEVHDELQRADSEARAAADDAGRRAQAGPDDAVADESGRAGAGLEDASQDRAGEDDAGRDDAGGESSAIEPGSQGSGGTSPVIEAPGQDVAQLPGTEVGAAGAQTTVRDPDALPPVQGDHDAISSSFLDAGGVGAPDGPLEGERVLRPQGSSRWPGLRPRADVAAGGVARDGAPALDAGRVDELFARIRSDRAAEVDAARQVLVAAGSSPAPAPSGWPEHDTDDGLGLHRSDEDEAILQRRDVILAVIESALTKKLKRSLQDEQNELLDRLRGQRGAPRAATLLPDGPEQVVRLSETARGSLHLARQAGIDFVGGTSGHDVADDGVADDGVADDGVADDGVSDDGGADDGVADDLATSLITPLRRRLGDAVGDCAGDEQSMIVEAIGSVYREWKTQRVEPAVIDAVAAAFARGSFGAFPEGTLLRWVVEDTDGPCPDCDDNALAGYQPKGEAFPTGQQHPPAHAGCRCLLAPEV